MVLACLGKEEVGQWWLCGAGFMGDGRDGFRGWK